MDFTNKLARYYVDGVFSPPRILPISLTTTHRGSFIRFPSDHKMRRLAANSFNGALDDLRIYNRVLSSNEIQTIYAGAATLSQIPIAVAAAAKLPCQPVTPS